MQRRFGVQRGAELVKVRHLLLGATFDRAAIRFDLTKNQTQHGGFTRTIRTNQTNPIPTHNATAEIVDDLAAFIRLRHVNQVGHQCAGRIARIHPHGHLALLITAGGTFGTQLIQSLHTEHRTRAARFYAFANPDLFLRQEFIGARLLQ